MFMYYYVEIILDV